MDNHPSLQHRLPPSTPSMQSTAQSTLVTTSLLLMLTWLGAWLCDLSQALVLVASLVAVVLALAMVGLRRAWDDARRRETARATRTGQVATSGRHCPGPAPDRYEGDTTSVLDKRWSLDVFANIDAQRFAAVCETWFSWAGFDTRHESHRTHEGVDIWLHAPRLAGPVAIVRCKHAHDKPVGLQDLRDFQSVVSTCKDAHGTFTTTSTYTPEALQFAKENGIEVVDGRGLLRRILTRTRRSQQALLAVAYHGR